MRPTGVAARSLQHSTGLRCSSHVLPSIVATCTPPRLLQTDGGAARDVFRRGEGGLRPGRWTLPDGGVSATGPSTLGHADPGSYGVIDGRGINRSSLADRATCGRPAPRSPP